VQLTPAIPAIAGIFASASLGDVADREHVLVTGDCSAAPNVRSRRGGAAAADGSSSRVVTLGCSRPKHWTRCLR